jgi:hypothetical protein
MKSWRRSPGIIVFACLFSAIPVAQRRGPQGDALAFRFLGPVVGNSVASIAGVPGDPAIHYAGAASGGVRKTTDGGLRWAPVSDSMPVAAIGALAVAPSDQSVVWAGTLGGAALSRAGHAAGDALGGRTGTGRADRRARQLHRESDRRRAVVNAAAGDRERSKNPVAQPDLDFSVKLQLRLRDNISAAADMVNTIEVTRKQLEDVTRAYRDDRARRRC